MAACSRASDEPLGPSGAPARTASCGAATLDGRLYVCSWTRERGWVRCLLAAGQCRSPAAGTRSSRDGFAVQKAAIEEQTRRLIALTEPD